LPKEIQSIGESKNFLFLTAPTVSAFLTVGELKFLPPIRMNFRQFITAGDFSLLLSFDLSKESRVN
jgi:hypothetical protein